MKERGMRGMMVSEGGPMAGIHTKATAPRQHIRVKGNAKVKPGQGKPGAADTGPGARAGYRAAGGGMSPLTGETPKGKRRGK